jgi:hypothetical protein
MSNRYRFALVSGTVLAAMIDLHSPIAQAQSKVGVASAVNNEVAVGPRRLAVGSDVHANERVRTGDASTAQLLFLDQTNLNIGPRAEVTLDRFVYNPNRGAGNVVLSATRGAFRFVSGTQNPASYTIKTPSATIGVRGTVIDGAVTRNYSIIGVVEGVALVGGMTVLAGQLVIVYANGTIQGPFAYDPSVFNIYVGLDPKRFEYQDTKHDLLDQNFGINLRNEPPAPPPSKLGQFRARRR